MKTLSESGGLGTVVGPANYDAQAEDPEVGNRLEPSRNRGKALPSRSAIVNDKR